MAPRVEERGRIVSIGDGIVWIEGLPSAAIDDVLLLSDGSQAMVFHLTEKLIGAILLDQTGSFDGGSDCAAIESSAHDQGG